MLGVCIAEITTMISLVVGLGLGMQEGGGGGWRSEYWINKAEARFQFVPINKKTDWTAMDSQSQPIIKQSEALNLTNTCNQVSTEVQTFNQVSPTLVSCKVVK